MFDNDLSVNEILVSLESVLLLEYQPDMRTDDIISAAIERLENSKGIKFDRGLFELIELSELNFNQLSLLMRDLKTALSQLAFFTDMKFYHKNLAVTLSSVNYLGLSREELLNALKYMMDVHKFQKYHTNIIPPIKDALNQVPLCTLKRLFVCLLMLYQLGVYEGVAVVARLLYLGGLVS